MNEVHLNTGNEFIKHASVLKRHEGIGEEKKKI